MADVPAPLIVTAMMGSRDFAWAQDLRRRHYPVLRNMVPAHITLFHHIPPQREQELRRLLRAETDAVPPPSAQLKGLRQLSRGVAFDITSPDLLVLWERIANAFWHDLLPQDRAVPDLHLTVQNKADRAEALALHAALAQDFRQRPLSITGIGLWRYCGGPWEKVARYDFTAKKH